MEEMRDEADVLKELAKYEIDSCCQTLCLSSVVKEYIILLEEENKSLKEQLNAKL